FAIGACGEAIEYLLGQNGIFAKPQDELILEFTMKSMPSGFSCRRLRCKCVLIFSHAHADCALAAKRTRRSVSAADSTRVMVCGEVARVAPGLQTNSLRS